MAVYHGPAQRMNAAPFRRELAQCLALRRGLMHYLYVMIAQLAQTAACTGFHALEARLALSTMGGIRATARDQPD